MAKKKTISIHISDWNMGDRVLRVPRVQAAVILLDTTKLASDRMRAIYDLALAEGSVLNNPRASTIEHADMFLSWPGIGLGFFPDDRWDAEHAEDLEALL